MGCSRGLTWPSSVPSGLKKYGNYYGVGLMQLPKRRSMSIVKMSIDAGKPLLLCGANITKLKGHYVTISGYSGSQIIIRDTGQTLQRIAICLNGFRLHRV